VKKEQQLQAGTSHGQGFLGVALKLGGEADGQQQLQEAAGQITTPIL
jgi:hypothetical protein